MARTAERPEVRHRHGHLLGQTVALAGFYYLVPVGTDQSTSALWLRAVGAAVLFSGALWLVVRAVARQARAEDSAVQLDRLALAAIAGVICFALADYAIARVDPTQFVGLDTKTDALYFAVTTLSTVGYGDVHAAGQFARQVVLVQMVFNIVVLASAARTLSRGLQERTRRSRERGDRDQN